MGLICQFPTRCREIFQTMNSVGSKSLSLKYQRFTPSGCKDMWIRKFKFLAPLKNKRSRIYNVRPRKVKIISAKVL